MSSWTDRRPVVLRGGVTVTPARLDVDLTGPSASASGIDPRLLSPALAEQFRAAVDQAAAQARTLAEAEGYAAGMAQGTADAETQVTQATREATAEVAARSAALRDAANRLDQEAQRLGAALAPTVADCEEQVLATALDIAQLIVGQSLATDTGVLRGYIEGALSDVSVEAPVRVRLAPALATTLTDDGEFAGRAVTVVADPHVAAGDVVVEAGTTHVERCLQATVDRIRQGLIG
jgi:flagellar assembly protein FliH